MFFGLSPRLQKLTVSLAIKMPAVNVLELVDQFNFVESGYTSLLLANTGDHEDFILP